MLQDADFEKRVGEVQKWAKLSGQSFDVDAHKVERVQNFCDDLERNLNSKDVFNKIYAQEKLMQNPDLFTIEYLRNTFWEKITRSKANPKVRMLKEPEVIFGTLYHRDDAFKSDSNYWMEHKLGLYKHDVSEKRALKRKLEKLSGPVFDKDGDFLPDTLALVHVTSYKPQKDENGCYMVDTLAQATDFQYPRNTVHFAISHHVESHMFGSWDDMPYVLVASMKDTIDRVGKPLGISSVDTFFEFGTDEKMVFPNTTHLIEPAGDRALPKDQLWVRQGNRTIYKSKGFSDEQKKTYGVQTDEEAAIALKKEVLARFLTEKNYTQGCCLSSFKEANSEAAQKIADMGKKMGVHSIAEKNLHAGIGLYGDFRMGESIDDVMFYIDGVSSLVGAKSIQVDEHGYFVTDGKRIDLSKGNLSYYSRVFQSMSDLDAFFSYDLKRETEKIIGVTEKEMAVFNVWKQKRQQEINQLNEKMGGKTLQQFVDAKMNAVTPTIIALKDAGR